MVSNKPEVVLVLDADMVPALSVARSLGRKRLTVEVASHAEKPLAGYSRFVSARHLYPDPLKNEAEFLAWCGRILSNDRYRLVIPVTERTVVPLAGLRGAPGGEKLAIAPVESLAKVLDKQKTLELAQSLDIRTPKSRLVDCVSDALEAAEAVDMPVVLKPARSIGADQAERKQLAVDYAFDRRELASKVEFLVRYGPVLLQEYVSGAGVGIELIADHGDIVFAFQHRRLHEVPLTGGGSSFRMSVPIESELLEASRKLVEALGWHGVAMVEFKWDEQTRRLSLMEINGRLWGSLPLAVAAGADFPAMLYELHALGGVEPRPEAKPGVYCRKLSADLFWQELVIRRAAPSRLVSFPSKRKIAADWFKMFSWKHHFDVQQWSDPMPGLVDLKRILTKQAERLRNLLEDRRTIRSQLEAWRSGEVAARLGRAKRILFLCYGNINRSALAERYFLKAAPETEVDVVSAGFHQQDGREADPVMVEVAAEAGVDMRGWSSRRLTADMLKDCDIVFVMELKHFAQVCREHPDACSKTYFLNAGMAQQGGDPEIADPYGKARSTYEACARQIFAAVDSVTKDIRGRQA